MLFPLTNLADATRAPGEMNLKRQMLQDLGLRGWIAEGTRDRGVDDLQMCFLLDCLTWK